MTALTRPTLLTTRRIGAAAFTAALLASGLSACGSAEENTTCSEWNAKSDADKRELFKTVIEDHGGVTPEEKDLIASGGAQALDTAAKIITSACANADADTKLKDLK